MEINGLEGFRYSITGLANGKSTSFRYANTASLTVTMAATYDNLIQFHQNRIRNESNSSNPEQICRNSLTALRGFLQWMGKSGSSPIGAEFGVEFDDALSRLEQARLGLNSDTGSAPPDVRQTADALHVEDDIDELIPYIGGPMPGWACLLTPFFNLLAYVLGKTIYRNVQLKKSSSSLDQDDTDV